MDFFTARYYGSALGRFTSPDPANAGADLLDPQSWNAYAYVRNNPLALVDPLGLCHMGADNVAYDDEPGDCGGGSVTVVAQAPPDVIPIFVSLPSLLSDTQQPAPTAPPPAVTEAGAGVRPPKNDPKKPGYCNVSGSSSIVTLTGTKALTEVGAFVGSLFGPEGTVVGAVLGSQFGAGVNIAYVNATHSVYIGVTGTFAPAQIGGGGGFSLSYTPVPATQNANSIANGTSYGVSFQANPLLGSTVSKSPGSGPPVVGFQVGTRAPVSFSASHNICIWHCGC